MRKTLRRILDRLRTATGGKLRPTTLVNAGRPASGRIQTLVPVPVPVRTRR